MQLLGDREQANGEIIVERVKALRWAETKGNYAQMFTALNS